MTRYDEGDPHGQGQGQDVKLKSCKKNESNANSRDFSKPPLKRFKSKTPESRNEEEFHAKLQDINDLKSSQSKHRETLKDIKSSMRRDLTLMPKVMEKLEVDVPEETRQTTEGKSFKILKSETMGMRRTGSNFDLKDDRNLLKH